MKLAMTKLWGAGYWLVPCLLWMALGVRGVAQGLTTTTVQGTVYQANGQAIGGVLQLSWPAFTTAANQAVAAGHTIVTIGGDGFVSVNLAPNQGATPAGLYYTATYNLSNGSTSTEYWVVPAAAQASLAQVRAQVMPAAQAVQAVSKAYVDQSVSEVTQSLLTAGGGSLTGPLYLNGDPQQPTQAADKHYVDDAFAQAVPLQGGVMTGPLTAPQLGAVYQADQFTGADFGARVQACLNGLNSTYGGTCDARNFSGTQTMSASLVIATANATLQLPCATISTAHQVVIAAGVRNVTLHGCALRGASGASGSAGGTVFLYTGNGAMVQVGDANYAKDTMGFHLDNVVINTTGATSASAQGIVVYRTQELDLESLYLLGNSNQTGITLDGTGNYTGGTIADVQLDGFQTGLHAIGHQTANSATTDWTNASTFVRLHIDCPMTNGNATSGTYGINLQQGDGNTFTGGDIEGCGTALHLGANAQNNTILGLRNENSINQIVADAGSSYNNWITGGTMFTGQLVDNGTRNSFLDTFHRSFNGLNGDWYGSQQDATVTNHFRIGIGAGNERGLLNRYQTDSGYRWTMGLSDATAGEQFYQLLDELNNVYRLSIGQYNGGQSSTNNQTVINAAGTGAVVLNGSTNAGTGGVVFGAGGSNGATVATVSSAGNAQFNGTLQVGSTAQSTGTMTVRNNADAEVDYYLWPGLTTSQKGSFTYKDWNGNSQWYMVKDASNNWALNSAVSGLDSFKAYQSSNSGDTYINASNAGGTVRVNYETGAGSVFNIYGGNSNALYASFSGTTAIKFPGLAAGSGHNCLQVDNSGYLTNTGAACSIGGTVNSASLGQIAYYTANGTAIGGVSAVPLTAGGTGATTASAGLANLGGLSTSGGALTGPVTLPGNPSSALQAVPKQYVDAETTRAEAMEAANAASAAAAQSTASAALPSNGLITTPGGGLQAGTIAAGTTCPSGLAAGTVCGSNIFDVTRYGAVGDEQNNNTGTIAVGSNVLTTAGSPTFAASDVGKSITLPMDLTAVTDINGATPANLTVGTTTTITGYNSPNSVNLAATAAVACTGTCSVGWGTSNTTAINKAFTALNASPNGGILYFPKGSYLFDPVVFNLNGVDLEIAGNSATLWSTQSKGNNAQTILISGATGAHGVYVHGLTLDFVVPMNTSNGTDFANSHTYTPYADAIRIGNNCNAPSSIPSYCTAPYPGTLNDIRVDHVQVYNARMTGIAVNYADRVILTNNTVMHVGQGITSANSVGSNVISGNIVRDSSDDLIGVYNNEYLINPNAQTGKAVISNNVLGQGYAKAIGVGGIGHVVISNNTTEQTWAAGILVEDQAVFNETASTDVLITGNVINSAGTYYGANQFHTAPSPDGASGMFFYGTPSTLNDLKIENNIITGYYFHGIEFTTASGMGVTQATIANNYINGSPTCPVCVSSGIQSTGDGIVVGVPGDTTSTSVAGLRIHDNTILNSAQSGIQLGGSNKVSIKNNWIEGFNANPGGQQTEGIGINYANSLIMDNNIVINSNGGTYPYHFFYTNTAVSQSRNLYSSGVGQPWTDYSASAAPLQATYQQMDAQPATGGMLGFLLDRADAPGAGLSIYAPSNNHMDIMTGPGTGTYLVVTSGWTASGGTVTFTETSGPTLAAGTLIAPNGLAGCSTASGVSPLNNGYYSVLSGATSTSFQISTTLITGGGSGTCNFTPLAPAMRFDTGYGGGINPGYMRLAPLSTDFTGATHPIEFGASSYYGDQAGNFYLNSLHIAGCTGYLYSNGTCSIPATGLADPGSNGIVKRTALNTTAPATAADVTTLFASGSCVGYMKGDGTCANVSPGGYVQLGHTVVSGTTTTSVVFSAINQGYTNLILVMYGATSDSGPNARIDCEYNSDTTAADYVGQYVQGVGTVTTSGALTGAATGIECGVLAAATANSSYNATTSTVSIPSYASSAFTTKAATLTTSYPASTGLISQTTVTSWKQANGTAITSITVTDGIGGHFMPGTTFTLYGEP